MRARLAWIAITLVGGCDVLGADKGDVGAADTDVVDAGGDSDGSFLDTDERDSGGDTDRGDSDVGGDTDLGGGDTDVVDTDLGDTDVVDSDVVDTDSDTDAGPFCGDGRIDPGEECDDIYDFIPGDGCTGCVVDSYWYCYGEPSYCVVL